MVTVAFQFNRKMTSACHRGLTKLGNVCGACDEVLCMYIARVHESNCPRDFYYRTLECHPGILSAMGKRARTSVY